MKSKIKLTDRYIKQIGLDLDEYENLSIIRKGFHTEVDEDEEGYVIGKITTNDIDSDGDIILPNGIDFSRYVKNPIILKNHSLEHPIGYAEKIELNHDSVVAKIKFGSTKEAQDVHQLMKDRVLRTFSIGFITLEFKTKNQIGFEMLLKDLQNKYPTKFNKDNIHKVDRIITKSLLIETSVVSVPANEYAEAIIVKTFSENDEEDTNLVEINDLKSVKIRKVSEIGVVIKKIGSVDEQNEKILRDIYVKYWGI